MEQVDALLRASVEARLEADVPLGCFLSGGVDSSLIAHYAQARLGGGLRTFTVRMPMGSYDESEYAREVATHLKTEHHVLDVRPSPAEDVCRLVEQLGQPFGDSSILPTYWVSAAAGAHVKAALAGDGGDELFVGYERLVAAEWLARHRNKMKFAPVRGRALARFGPKSKLNKAGRLLDAARSRQGYLDLAHVFSERVWHGVAPDSTIADGDAPSGIEEALSYEFGHSLPGDLLRKVDTASMAVPLEVRSPFLDRAVMEAGLGATVDSLMMGESGRRRERKGLLRAVAARHLPRRVVERRKMGFAIPIGQWFRTNEGSMRELLLDALKPSGTELVDHGFSRRGVRELLNAHMHGHGSYEHCLFTLLTTVLWLRWLKRI
ncbi:MAG: asparagine synthase [Planctomycetes bacterium]|nr:asparagine synthase [Planctomycetota bacterium]